MLKKSITYTNFNDEEVTEEFYFNLSKAELVKMEVSRDGGMKEHLERIVATNDGKQIIAEMEKIVQAAYGVKSEDGKRFIKTPELWEEFKTSEAYSVFFMELVTQADKAAEFVNAVIPRDLQEQVSRAQMEIAAEEATADEPKPLVEPEDAPPPGPRKLTEAELREIDADELKSGLATGKYIL